MISYEHVLMAKNAREIMSRAEDKLRSIGWVVKSSGVGYFAGPKGEEREMSAKGLYDAAVHYAGFAIEGWKK